MQVKLNQDVTVWDDEDKEYVFEKGTEFDVVESYVDATLKSGEIISLPEEMFSGDELKGVHIKSDGTIVKNEDITDIEWNYTIQTLDRKWRFNAPSSYFDKY